MKRLLVLLCTVAAPAFADDRGLCVIEAAAHLPQVPGLVVEHSVASQRPNPATRSLYVVKLNVKAAGEQAAFTYVCGVSKDGQIAINRVAE